MTSACVAIPLRCGKGRGKGKSTEEEEEDTDASDSASDTSSNSSHVSYGPIFVYARRCRQDDSDWEAFQDSDTDSYASVGSLCVDAAS